MSEAICYVNGNYVPLGQATLPVTDLAILRGFGVFDFTRTYNGQPFRLDDHLQRLENSARLIGLDLPWSRTELAELTLNTLGRNTLPDANIRIVVTGGSSGDGITPGTNPSLIIIISPTSKYPRAYFEQGIKVITVDMARIAPNAKTINYIPAILALQFARQAAATDALYLDNNGNILEGTTINFFIFRGSQLITPREGILKGITRNVVLELVKGHFDVVEAPISRADMAAADEAFITSTTKEVMPVRQVDDQIIGAGKVGPHTQTVMRLFHDYVTSGEAG